jgi:hypothetical protein
LLLAVSGLLVILTRGIVGPLPAGAGAAARPRQDEPPAARLHVPLTQKGVNIAGAGPALEPVGQLGGAVGPVAGRDGLIYAGIGQRLAVLDARDDLRPRLVGQTAPLGWWPADIALRWPYAYVAAGTAGLWLFDVGNAAAPTPLLQAIDDATVRAVALDGDRAYLAAAGAGLIILDIGHPTRAIELARYRGEGPGYENELASATDVAVVGSMAYVSNDDDYGLWAIDVSRPDRPRRTAMSSQQDGIAVAAAGHTVYQLDNDAGLTIYDARDPRDLKTIGGFDDDHMVDIALVGPFAFLASSRSGPAATSRVRVLDVADPGHPREVATLPTPGQAWAIGRDEGRLFVGDGRGGARIYRITDPAAPVARGAYRALGGTRAVAVEGGFAYVADNPGPAPGYGLDPSSRLEVVDVSDPAAPGHLGSVDTPATAVEMVAAGRWLYLACELAGVRVLDIGDPAHPREAGVFDRPASGLAHGGQRLYTASVERDASAPGQGLVRILDASDPTALRQLGAFTTPIQALGPLAALGTTVYAADSSGIVVADTSDPAQPRRHAFLPGYVVDLATYGSRLYALQQRFLVIYDLADPAAPRQLALASLSEDLGIGWRLAVSGRYVQVVTTGGIVTLDMLDAAAPRETSRWLGQWVWDAAASDGRVFAATDTLGLVIFETG